MDTMTQELLKLIQQVQTLRDVATLWQSGHKSLSLTGLTGSVKAGFLCALKEQLSYNGPLVFLVANRDEERALKREILTYYPDTPSYELYPASFVGGHVETKNEEVGAERIAALEALLKEKPVLIFVTAEAFIQKLPDISFLEQYKLVLQVGSKLPQDQLLTTLVEGGYERVEQVETLGQFAIRGDILDVFPLNQENPLRIEWFDEEVDAIRPFELASQRSLDNWQQAEILPVTTQEMAVQADLFSYVHKGSLLVLNEPVSFLAEAQKSYKDNVGEHEDFLFTPTETEEQCHNKKMIMVSALSHALFPKANQVAVPVRTVAPYNKDLELLVKDLGTYLQDGVTPLIMLSSTEKAKTLAENLKHQDLPVRYVEKGSLLLPGAITVFTGEAGGGFYFWDAKWLLFTEGDIYGMQKRRRLIRHKGQGPALNYFTDIKNGDYVVHDIHGIGRYMGVETIEVDGVHRDYLRIQYAGEDRLFVPIDQISLLHKYVGSEGTAPRLSRMGGADWQRVTKKAKAAVTLLATELLRLYAQRKITPGHSFSPDTTWQKEFEAAFPFEETADQLQATKEIKSDMERPVPMERLLCGDVGYGKTEVAIRAVFKAVMDGKQVAVLAPTTVLAQQHLLTFSQRMGSFGVKVEMLSRFRTPKEQKEIMDQVAQGQVDVLIGTHRILQPDLQFKDLGLLIIDEEQRFGVAQKEKIKKWSTGIDVLTLSATPIPRTLHLALVKGKDMSIIETPPEDRLPVETYVAEYDDGMIKEAIEREMRRGGQIYYVYNRVQGLTAIAKHLRELVPNLSLRIAHGQMNEDELEDAMISFYNGEYDLLLCTTIIENGLDVPRANTIIIQGAEYFGLSQLYQMRGRVGRSSKLAYAYLVYKKQRALSEIAQKRLQAIRDFTELGAGFKIAMRDLEIRGAGNLLGKEQHGHIAGIGFAAYCKLLEDTINQLQGNAVNAEPVREPVLEITLDAYIPDDYIDNPRYKLELYRRFSDLHYEERSDLMDEIIDRFGQPPDEVVNLWRLSVIRSLCRLLLLDGISIGARELRINFGEHSTASPEAIMKLVRLYVPFMQFKNIGRPQLIIKRQAIDGELLTWLEKLLVAMAK